MGFWMFLFVLMWGISGIYLSYADPFVNLVDYLQPMDPNSTQPRSGDDFLAWLARVHFGRAYGTSVKWLYVVLGLAPARPVRHRRDHVVEPRPATGAAQERHGRRRRLAILKSQVCSRRTSHSKRSAHRRDRYRAGFWMSAATQLPPSHRLFSEHEYSKSS